MQVQILPRSTLYMGLNVNLAKDMKSKITIYQADDRQARKYFSIRPTFISGHDIFTGPCVRELPKNLRSYRLVTRFKARVTGGLVGRYGYPKEFQVKPR